MGEYPVFGSAARVLSLGGRKGFTLVTSPMCLAISFYFAEKKSGTDIARTKVALISYCGMSFGSRRLMGRGSESQLNPDCDKIQSVLENK